MQNIPLPVRFMFSPSIGLLKKHGFQVTMTSYGELAVPSRLHFPVYENQIVSPIGHSCSLKIDEMEKNDIDEIYYKNIEERNANVKLDFDESVVSIKKRREIFKADFYHFRMLTTPRTSRCFSDRAGTAARPKGHSRGCRPPPRRTALYNSHHTPCLRSEAYRPPESPETTS